MGSQDNNNKTSTAPLSTDSSSEVKQMELVITTAPTQKCSVKKCVLKIFYRRKHSYFRKCKGEFVPDFGHSYRQSSFASVKCTLDSLIFKKIANQKRSFRLMEKQVCLTESPTVYLLCADSFDDTHNVYVVTQQHVYITLQPLKLNRNNVIMNT